MGTKCFHKVNKRLASTNAPQVTATLWAVVPCWVASRLSDVSHHRDTYLGEMQMDTCRKDAPVWSDPGVPVKAQAMAKRQEHPPADPAGSDHIGVQEATSMGGALSLVVPPEILAPPGCVPLATPVQVASTVASAVL